MYRVGELEQFIIVEVPWEKWTAKSKSIDSRVGELDRKGVSDDQATDR